jgi:hypothetical protein
MTSAEQRRKYHEGHCMDCGRVKRVTVIFFWATGMRYVVCAECIKPYRKVILAPCTKECIHNHAA